MIVCTSTQQAYKQQADAYAIVEASGIHYGEVIFLVFTNRQDLIDHLKIDPNSCLELGQLYDLTDLIQQVIREKGLPGNPQKYYAKSSKIVFIQGKWSFDVLAQIAEENQAIAELEDPDPYDEGTDWTLIDNGPDSGFYQDEKGGPTFCY